MINSKNQKIPKYSGPKREFSRSTGTGLGSFQTWVSAVPGVGLGRRGSGPGTGHGSGRGSSMRVSR